MIISLIAALTSDHVIGNNKTIPWHISADLSWFKRHTLNKPVIMGRKTFESIGKILPNRYNIVLSRHSINKTGVTWVNTQKQALEAAKAIGNIKEIMIIGGGEVYNLFFNQAERMYLTYINVNYITGDTWFPKYDPWDWTSIFREEHNDHYSYYFEILVKNR